MKTYKDYKTFEQYLNEHFDYFAEVGVPVKVYWMASNGDITLFYSQNRFRDDFFEDADFLRETTWCATSIASRSCFTASGLSDMIKS